MAWDSESGGASERERTGAREEYSFSVCFAFKRFLLGAVWCLLGFWFLAAAIGRQRKRRRRRGAVEVDTAARWRSSENDDANDIVYGKWNESNHCVEIVKYE